MIIGKMPFYKGEHCCLKNSLLALGVDATLFDADFGSRPMLPFEAQKALSPQGLLLEPILVYNSFLAYEDLLKALPSALIEGLGSSEYLPLIIKSKIGLGYHASALLFGKKESIMLCTLTGGIRKINLSLEMPPVLGVYALLCYDNNEVVFYSENLGLISRYLY